MILSDPGVVTDSHNRSGCRLQLSVKLILVYKIQRTGGFIQDGVPGFRKEHASKGQTLLLAHRQNLSPIQYRVQTSEPFD